MGLLGENVLPVRYRWGSLSLLRNGVRRSSTGERVERVGA
jgi:hypothetical protein